jgi:Tfp pilus assembly protein FimT
MFLLNEDGKTAAEMITLFALVSIITFFALPLYNNLITNSHDAKIKSMHQRLNTSIIISVNDSISVNGVFKVPFPHQLIKSRTINLAESKNWTNDGSGTWTYLPTGAQIIYRRIKQDDFSLIIDYRN